MGDGFESVAKAKETHYNVEEGVFGQDLAFCEMITQLILIGIVHIRIHSEYQ